MQTLNKATHLIKWLCLYWHCAHHLLFDTHVYGDAQTVEPEYPTPPHWPHCATALAPLTVADWVEVLLVVLVPVLVAAFVASVVLAAASVVLIEVDDPERVIYDVTVAEIGRAHV